MRVILIALTNRLDTIIADRALVCAPATEEGLGSMNRIVVAYFGPLSFMVKETRCFRMNLEWLPDLHCAFQVFSPLKDIDPVLIFSSKITI